VKRIDTSQLPARGLRFLYGQGTCVGEIHLHHTLHHPNCVQLIEAFNDRSASMVSLVLEFCRGGDLLEIVLDHREKHGRGLDELVVKPLTQQLFKALNFLHNRGVVHRDVKCENIFCLEDRKTAPLESATFKLGDFGLAACVMPNEVLMDQVGSPSTSAPEVVHGHPYGKLADVWSAGAAIFTALFAKRPPEATVLHKLGNKVEKLLTGELWESISEDAKDLLKSMMQPSPLKRTSAAQVLEHPWCAKQ